MKIKYKVSKSYQRLKKILLFISLFLNFTAIAKMTQNQSPRFALYPVDSSEKMPDSVLIRDWQNKEIYERPIFLKAAFDGHSFKFSLPIKAPLMMFDIVFYYGKKQLKSLYHFAEPNDDVILYFRAGDRNSSLNVSGVGAIKYQLAEQLGKESMDFHISVVNFDRRTKTSLKLFSDSLVNESEIHSYVDSLKSLAMLSEARSLKILSEFKSRLSPNLLNFYKYECIVGRTKQFVYSGFIKSIKNKKNSAKYCLSRNTGFLEMNNDNPLLKYGTWYVFHKSFNLAIEAAMESAGKELYFKDRYSSLKSIENLELRDRLITYLFAYPGISQRYITNFDSKDSCLTDALDIIKDPHLISELSRDVITKKGNEIFSFSFQDSNQKYIRSIDLRGKVFIIKFYGWGCTGCEQFHKQFKKDIYPEFSKNSNFKVISVSIDKSKERWLQSMESKKYTSEDYINLYIGNKGIKSDFFKYYKVNAIPFILLVDEDGRLIERLHNGMQSTFISTKIRGALAAQKLRVKNSM
ncbi:TlpA family protein disulfide reductase [Pedobacter nyackensis]|uniref:Thioredoxin-like n=1 Tax=Pedobacter nyackensis TaxID=475255 RepID=A0A1W2DKZ1_9SPHI|nr:thioredoxin family protein [Pedobacter nyackensis]SMC98109.1 Thioredoxin-like [Pedobacter nyackensis]